MKTKLSIKKALAAVTAVICALVYLVPAVPVVSNAAKKDPMTLSLYAIELVPGGSETLTASFPGREAESVTFESSDTGVATVDDSGKITAVAIGQAVVTVTCEALDFSAACDVYVVEERYTYGQDNILISIFWPPQDGYITDEQYRLLAEAGVNWVLGVGGDNVTYTENQKKMLALCAKYNMGMSVCDQKYYDFLFARNSYRIDEYVNKYANAAAAEGFFVIDEPTVPNDYVDIFLALKQRNPSAYIHLNFLPSSCYETTEIYEAQMNDFCRLVAAGGYSVDYLMYDRYPFGLTEGTMDYTGYFQNLRSAHDVGLKNNVRTANYIQTVRQDVSFRRPNDQEIRYEMYSTLAFGFKQLSFFTWFTPTNQAEPFSDGIISSDGVPNEHYETIKTLNAEIHAIGTVLAKCDALEIYLNGISYDQPTIPSDFFVQPGDNNNYVISLMKHNETGRNYLMVVNNKFKRAQTIKLDFDSSVTELWEVSKEDGSLVPLSMDGSTLTLELAAGDGILIALPENLDFTEAQTAPEDGANIAADALITCSESEGNNGYYISFLNDGRRTSNGRENGWRSRDGEAQYIELDFGMSLDFNRIDLFAAGGVTDEDEEDESDESGETDETDETEDSEETAEDSILGEYTPKSFTISVSTDGVNYTTVKTVENFSQNGGSVTFDKVNARYVRIDITETRNGLAALAEIEVYNDTGNSKKSGGCKGLVSGAVSVPAAMCAGVILLKKRKKK